MHDVQEISLALMFKSCMKFHWAEYIFVSSLQVDEYPTEYSEEQTDQHEVAEEEHEDETEEQESSQVTELEEVKNGCFRRFVLFHGDP